MYVVYSDANEQESNLLLFLPRCCCCCFCSWGKCVRARSSLGHVYIVVYSLWSPSPPSRLSALNFIAQPLERSKSLLIKSITLQLSNSPSLSLVHVSLPPISHLSLGSPFHRHRANKNPREVFRWWVSMHYILYYEFTCTNQWPCWLIRHLIYPSIHRHPWSIDRLIGHFTCSSELPCCCCWQPDLSSCVTTGQRLPAASHTTAL